ncbi:MAG: hypothetical protein J6O13_02085 [Selenomonas sp.]|nr:hypothetical protein [Selenomonas sp.]
MDYERYSKRYIHRLLIIACLLTFSIICLTGCSNKDVASLQNEVLSVLDDEYVTRVKSGHLEMAPNIPIGDAFARFFGEPEWKSFESADGQRVVEFNGKCTWQDKPATCRMQFIIKGDNGFEMGAVSINDNNLTVLETAFIMAKILGESANDSPASTSTSKENSTVSTSDSGYKSDNKAVSVPRPTSDALLGNVKLGYSLAEAESSLGSPSKKTVKEKGKLRYEYPLMDVAYDYGAVVGMATDDASVTTPKGIHAGSSLQEVMNKYGSDYMLSTYDNLDLYEYEFTDDNQKTYLLRFAVRQGTGNVKYISIRYVD